MPLKFSILKKEKKTNPKYHHHHFPQQTITPAVAAATAKTDTASCSPDTATESLNNMHTML